MQNSHQYKSGYNILFYKVELWWRIGIDRRWNTLATKQLCLDLEEQWRCTMLQSNKLNLLEETLRTFNEYEYPKINGKKFFTLIGSLVVEDDLFNDFGEWDNITRGSLPLCFKLKIHISTVPSSSHREGSEIRKMTCSLEKILRNTPKWNDISISVLE